MANLIRRRLDQLVAADDLEMLRSLPQARCHELTGNRKGQIAVDVRHPKRMILKSVDDPLPKKDDGGLDWTRITKVGIQEIVDYHG